MDVWCLSYSWCDVRRLTTQSLVKHFRDSSKPLWLWWDYSLQVHHTGDPSRMLLGIGLIKCYHTNTCIDTYPSTTIGLALFFSTEHLKLKLQQWLVVCLGCEDTDLPRPQLYQRASADSANVFNLLKDEPSLVALKIKQHLWESDHVLICHST